MAISDSAPLLPGIGHILLGTTGATKPALADLTAFAANTATLPTGFTDFGHTDLSNVLTFGQDGGDTTVKGSWQNASLREIVTTALVDHMVVKSIQFKDNTVLSLYYGGGDATTANEFAWPDTATPTEKALTLIMLDGTTPMALYASKVSIRREAEIEVTSDDYTKLPLRFTFLKNSSNPRAIWIADAIGA